MTLRDDVVQMMRDRAAARVWLTTLASPTSDFDELAIAAGLAPLGRAWVSVDRGRAEHFLAGLLRVDLAYKSEVMPEHRAEWLASEFVRAFGRYDVRFATNSSDLPDRFPFGWTPATGLAFDAGLAVIGRHGAAIYWVGDED
ncbi:hypothetical protein FB00_08075 [Cellulosimicrobium funkei]|uniref:Uncharacterized protein n=1 Tax=Cellulosimicrobium funkei TaxID=264251 RepID=A0A0H2KP86_9MICO|nr:hypothetical protein [Cellulosimicrobium funkei]KLN35366.1 hypothetical protein FB00_08075 [Cellulosimicrobium funkei]